MAETYEYLNDEEKTNIITNHLRNLEYSMYNNEVSLLAIQNGGVTGQEEYVETLQSDINDIKAKITALKALLP